MSKTFNMVGSGANVVANPALTGTETDLQGLEVNGTKYKVPLIRPNLLDNWYFVGGGSQQGGGKFPVNQRGQTTYTGSMSSSIDRWRSSSTGKLTVNSDYITWETTATSQALLEQKIESPEKLFGKTVTLSALMADGGLLTGTGVVPTSFPTSGQTTVVNPGPWRIAFAYYPSQSGIVQILANPTTRMVSAIKLELGEGQTLAHLENGQWVLNEIPNYTEELWKCQRYYHLFASSTYRPTYGEDYRPPMRLHSPSKGTISIGGTTYYYADANL